MRAVWGWVLSAALGAPAFAGEKCLAWRDEFQTQADAAGALNQKSIAAALAARKLTRVELEVEVLQERFAPVGAYQHDGADYYVAGSAEGSNEPQPSAQFVEDAAHDLFVLDLKPETTSKKRYLVCGCGPPTGGGAFMPRVIAYRIPKNRALKGHISVAYREKRVAIDWTRRDERGGICAEPPRSAPMPEPVP